LSTPIIGIEWAVSEVEAGAAAAAPGSKYEDDRMGQLASTQYATTATASPSSASMASTFSTLEHLVDQAAVFNAFVVAEENSSARRDSGFGVLTSQRLHRFNAETRIAGSCVKASNEIGQVVGKISQRWILVPDDYVAAPRRYPPQAPFNGEVSQRFV